MRDPLLDAILKLVREDKRFKLEAYLFIFDSLNYAQTALGMGSAQPPEESEEPAPEGERGPERHLTGQQLCEAVRAYAWDQYGMMARCVLNSWGIHTTSDLGEIVYNLIKAERMRKTDRDRREDFNDVFDLDSSLVDEFQIKLPDPK